MGMCKFSRIVVVPDARVSSVSRKWEMQEESQWREIARLLGRSRRGQRGPSAERDSDCERFLLRSDFGNGSDSKFEEMRAGTWVNQPKVSALTRYKLEGFSVERLMLFLTSLDQDVEIVIKKKASVRKPARISVIAA